MKHGYSNFSLEILEYCTPDKAVSREQYFLDLLPHTEYNILKLAGSSLGYKHTANALKKISAAGKDRKQPSEDTIAKISAAKKGSARPKGAGRPSIPIEVLDTFTNETTVYLSISEAARAINVPYNTIAIAFQRLPAGAESTIWVQKKRYQITKLSSN